MNFKEWRNNCLSISPILHSYTYTEKDIRLKFEFITVFLYFYLLNLATVPASNLPRNEVNGSKIQQRFPEASLEYQDPPYPKLAVAILFSDPNKMPFCTLSLSWYEFGHSLWQSGISYLFFYSVFSLHALAVGYLLMAGSIILVNPRGAIPENEYDIPSKWSLVFLNYSTFFWRFQTFFFLL